MRVIKLGLISIVFLFLVATAISLLIPSHIRISKAINLSAQKNVVVGYIKDTTKWKQWHPAFIPSDSAKKFPAITIIPKAVNDSEVVMQMQQENKTAVISGWKIYEYASTDSITLQWYMDFNIKWYPWQKIGSMFYENTYGVMMQEGLTNMKQLVQK